MWRPQSVRLSSAHLSRLAWRCPPLWGYGRKPAALVQDGHNRHPLPRQSGPCDASSNSMVTCNYGDHQAHARAFRDALVRLRRRPTPARPPALPKLLKQDLSNYPRRNAQTVNKTLALLSGVLARAERDGHFEALPAWSNPFHIGFDVAPAEREPYEPFSAAELQRLFASPVYARGERPLGGQGEAAYWFPLIALFSGARRTEIAQLKIGDVRQGENEIWYSTSPTREMTKT